MTYPICFIMYAFSLINVYNIIDTLSAEMV